MASWTAGVVRRAVSARLRAVEQVLEMFGPAAIGGRVTQLREHLDADGGICRVEVVGEPDDTVLVVLERVGDFTSTIWAVWEPVTFAALACAHPALLFRATGTPDAQGYVVRKGELVCLADERRVKRARATDDDEAR